MSDQEPDSSSSGAAPASKTDGTERNVGWKWELLGVLFLALVIGLTTDIIRAIFE